MKKIALPFLLFLSIYKAYAVEDNYAIGSRSSALANASVSLGDVWSVHHNQAGMAFVKQISLASYYENRLLLKELSLKSCAAVMPFKVGTLGFSFSSFGFSLYSENKASCSFAKSFGDNFSVGLAMDYIQTHISEGYGNKGVVCAEVGMISQPIKNLRIGVHLFNPTRTFLVKSENEALPTIVRLGGNYTFSKKALLLLEVEKEVRQQVVFKTGIEYKPTENIFLRVGLSNHPSIYSFGVGLAIKSLTIDFSVMHEQLLGIRPGISLNYTFSK